VARSARCDAVHPGYGFLPAQSRTFYDWDWPGAEKEYQRAIELNPGYAEAHYYYGLSLRNTGRLPEALAETKRAQELDPLSLLINWGLGLAFYTARQYDKAIEQERKTVELEPIYVLAHRTLAMAYLQKSMYKNAMVELEKALVISPGNPYALSEVGYVYALSGRRAEAQQVLKQLTDLSRQKYVPRLQGHYLCGLGEKDKAFEWLEKSYENRYAVGEGAGPLKWTQFSIRCARTSDSRTFCAA
jgi:adenylate cyclase